jgi:hypothetical protein
MLRLTRGAWASPTRFLRSWFERTQEKTQAIREQDVFRAQIEHLSACERFGPDEYRTLLEKLREASGYGGRFWSKLTNASDDPFLKDLDDQEQLLQRLNTAQKERLLRLRRSERRNLAALLGTEERLVDGLIDRFAQTKFMHDWIRSRMQEGLPLPKNAQQMELLMLDPSQRRRLPGIRTRVVRARR